VAELVDTPPQIVFAEAALATPFVYRKSDRSIWGCLYTATGEKIAASERFGGQFGDRAIAVNPERTEIDPTVPVLAGTSMYLGHWMGRHYGHFLLETLSSTWAAREVDGVDHFVFHPFLPEFGTDIPPYAPPFLEPQGVDMDKLVILDGPQRLERVAIPERLTKINYQIHRRMRDVYAAIRDRVGVDANTPRHVFLSRARLPANRQRINEPAVEDLFGARGFAIVHPQELPIKEQVRIWAGCDVLAGFSGSGMHNAVFCRPDTQIIDLLDRSGSGGLRSQQLCNLLAGANAMKVPLKDGAVDLRAIERVLEEDCGQC
jgi:capsular polysaccharide biosynthesis protein